MTTAASPTPSSRFKLITSTLLDAGRVAPLVAMGDSETLANALLSVLAKPPQSQMLTEAVSAYHQDVSAAAYLQTLGLSA